MILLTVLLGVIIYFLLPEEKSDMDRVREYYRKKRRGILDVEE